MTETKKPFTTAGDQEEERCLVDEEYYAYVGPGSSLKLFMEGVRIMLIIVVVFAVLGVMTLPRGTFNVSRHHVFSPTLKEFHDERRVFHHDLTYWVKKISISTVIQKPNIDVNPAIKRVCYYAIPTGDTGGLLPEDVDVSLCTHIMLAFAHVGNSTIHMSNPGDAEIFKRVVNLKKKAPNLKVLLSIGGADGDCKSFSDLVKSPKEIAIFAYNAHKFLIKYGLDGLDLDWEFPGWPISEKNEEEKFLFTKLCIQLNNALKLASHPPLLLTAAVSASKAIIDRAYELPKVSKYLDFISLMGYDYHYFSKFLPFTGYNAPLHKRNQEHGTVSELNIEWSASYMLEKGVPREKLVVGIPTYGHSWRLIFPGWNKVASPAVGPGIYNGSVSYPEICKFLGNGAQKVYDPVSKVPYAFKAQDWISYDDLQSTAAKVEWIKSNNFSGIMTWNLNCDDWRGSCSYIRFPLHKVIRDGTIRIEN
ncbi:chitinase-3-like protein 2 [Oratosquilla oratoria]|uniref:chitinase-3-like protein 2 n=1 Tax=Oratosquilla oratoria TaxID=337810 RepID=UPI003F775D94